MNSPRSWRASSTYLMSSKPSMTIAGLPVARGFASGPVFIYRGGGEIPVPEYLVEKGKERAELLRLKIGRASCRERV